MGMRRTALLLASMVLTVLLASGVALAALKTIKCEGWERCIGTDRRDLMKGDDRGNDIWGRDKGDILKGFGGYDELAGQKGDDRLVAGPSRDRLEPGTGDDTLDGGDGPDLYVFERTDWGNDHITDVTTDNRVLLPFRGEFTGTITTRLTSDPVLPEVTDAAGTNTINWEGNVVFSVLGSDGDDTITGNDDSNTLEDNYATSGGDTDNVSGAGGDDFINVEDGAGDDTVTCGGGADTVNFDQGDVLVVPGECESQNPPQ
jgi:large repetitive protein